ncbi:hypothetical protein CW732_18530 [Olleya sp. Bg11-27]|nr:hypothetical protein CW732_18530 [Olleya sp. Bg11-27]
MAFLFFVLFTISCSHKTFNTEKELIEYINQEENGYVINKSVNGYDFKLTYKPTDLLIKQFLVVDSDIQELRERYAKYLYFNLSISLNNQEILNGLATNTNKFGRMVNQLSFDMGDKAYLISQKKDTINFVDFIYPRMYGVSKATTIMFVYLRENRKLKDDYLNFIIKDLGLNTGEIKFKIETKLLINEPSLSFKKN